MKAQDADTLKVGDILTIETPKNYQYSHLNLPKANFIIKSGEIVNYKKLPGTRVEITKIKTKNSKTIVLLKRKDGKKFFGSFPSIRASYKKALASGELSR
ncbi:hypothetical protein GFO_1058 [Christiangramia forsetii KT0803]|uniref:Uncharacterized protein n=3 Tax=Christiangramia forsetii TaxID=411153 RepID=A0M087_CHRFK|nr:hypothetical protein GCM10011532_26600 [Christiangramia forsetii]CAL66032.1 hypothetical protein GFO_1058 [Christiangramia forsetii KT0803]